MQQYSIRAEIEPAYKKIIASRPFEKLTEYAQTSLTHYLLPLWPFEYYGAPPADNISHVNRKEHSISTYMIVRKFFEFHPEFKECDCEIPVLVAALCHDIGVPPAAHYTDHIISSLMDGIENCIIPK